MKITLKPGWPAQTIAATGQTCQPGEVIDVDEPSGLLAQSDKWVRYVAPKSEGTDKKDGDR